MSTTTRPPEPQLSNTAKYLYSAGLIDEASRLVRDAAEKINGLPWAHVARSAVLELEDLALNLKRAAGR